ncbi:hypothetical protein [Chryseobacterium rhizosphaerae]|jgi:hypothetical protein|uniref:hypothetical protein n=1 Tax=Chryseobacterium rhizosphaerae TaxID=395937 RepID=UPI00235944A6|nr:hypothetical protein [Chryseobacterium rhizosphaerae]MDC8101366.1 hypothetical protein [Chryseobacterium rhizosphaerae]MDR6544002.1 hypothetical protein [Chryseobacterium rhizosphaerae]
MSRTRIVRGTYNKISHEDHNMYSQENIISRAFKWFTEKGDKKGVSHNVPQYPPLEQLIQLVVQFRPNKNWKGEFGFDWIRMADTKLFNDISFKDIVAYQYFDSTYAKKVDSSKGSYVNKYDGAFKADETMFNNLKKEYKPFSIPWKTYKDKTGKEIPEEYYIPWLSLKKDKEAKITFFAEIKDEADYLEFTKSDYFTYTPDKIEIKGKKKISLDDFEITIKCIKEFTTDQAIELKAFKTKDGTTVEAIVGKINVWANDVTKHKKKDVVFVEIRTPEILIGNGKNKPNINTEKNRINQYLEQGYIQLSDTSIIVELDLASEKDFNDFITSSQIDSDKFSGGKSLDGYLKNKLEKAYPGKYSKHFKAFYFEEDGYHPSGGHVSGYSAPGADYVVVFKSKNDQTAAHEFLHAMNLPHTFTNKETTSNALFTYEFTKTDNLLDYSHRLGTGNNNNRCSLFYWQWKQANNSIK